MEKPGWATFMGVIMILIGGCSALDNYGDTNTDKALEKQAELFDDMDMDMEVARDTSTSEEIIDSTDEKVIRMFGDTMVRDSNNNVDVKQTIQNLIRMSPYRIQWLKRFGYIGLAIALLYILAGVLFLTHRKYTIQVALTVLAISLVFGIFQFIILRADTGSSQMISKISNFEVYWSIFLDIVLLLPIMVLDKSYFNEAYFEKPDYYDN